MKKNILLTATIALFMLPSCSNPVDKYIHNELPTLVWQEQLLPASVEVESSRVVSELYAFSKDSADFVTAIVSKNRNRARQLASEWRWGSEAENCIAIVNSLEPKVKKYKRHTKRVVTNLSTNVNKVMNQSFAPGTTPTISYSDNEICELLLGTPKNIASPTENDFNSVATAIVEKCVCQTKIPAVTYSKYDKKSDLYAVRFDCAEPLYLKAYKCENGEYEYEIIAGEDSRSNKDVSRSKKKGNTDWDSVLDDYEQYVDKYISLVKKASSGDMSALEEYAEFLEKAEALSSKLSNAKDNMTSAQVSRYMRISAKMTNAATSILNN